MPLRKVHRARGPIAFPHKLTERGNAELPAWPLSQPAQECQALASLTPSMTQREDGGGQWQGAQPHSWGSPSLSLTLES